MAPAQRLLWIGCAAFSALLLPVKAEAACERNGDTVVCTGTDNNGFLTDDSVRLTINTNALVRNIETDERAGYCPLSFPAIQVGLNSEVENNGDIRTDGVCGYGIASASNSTIINNGDINTRDIVSYGIIANNNMRITHNGTIATIGRSSDGINVLSNAVIEIGEDAVISTTGTSAAAILATSNATVVNNGALSTANIDSRGMELGANARVVNNGSIRTTGPRSSGIRAEGGTVDVVNTGTISSTVDRLVAVGPRGGGVILDGTTTTLTNSGTISGVFAGARLTSTQSGNVVNTGTIRGLWDEAVSTPGAGLLLQSVTGIQTRIENRGRIDGIDGVAAIRGGDGVEVIINTGTIGGDVILGGGDDRITQQSGGINGIIDMGGGYDRFNLASAGTFSRAILGVDELTKTGDTTANLAAHAQILDRALIGGGAIRLLPNGILEAPRIVTALTGTLSGQGTLRGAVENGGIVSPGMSIGTLNIVGSFTQTVDGRLEIEVDATGNDRLIVDGTVMLGGTLALSIAPGIDLTEGLSFPLITATQGISGTFATVTGTGSLFQRPTFSVNQGTLIVTIESATYEVAAKTAAQRNLAAMLNRVLPTAQGPAADLDDALEALPNLASATALFRQLAPEGPAAAHTLAVLSGRALASPFTIVAEMENGEADQTRAWGRFLDGNGHTETDADASAYSYALEGAAAGIDHTLSNDIRIGVGLGQVLSNGDLEDSRARANVVTAGAYAVTTWAETHLSATAFAGGGSVKTARSQTLDAQTRSLGMKSDLKTAGFVVSGHRNLSLSAAKLVPNAAVHLQTTRVDAASETAALGLQTDKAVWNSLRTALGLRAEIPIGIATPSLSATWMREHKQTSATITARLIDLAGSDFNLTGANLKRDQINIAAGVDFALAPGAALHIGYEGAVNDSLAGQRFSAGVMWRW